MCLYSVMDRISCSGTKRERLIVVVVHSSDVTNTRRPMGGEVCCSFVDLNILS